MIALIFSQKMTALIFSQKMIALIFRKRPRAGGPHEAPRLQPSGAMRAILLIALALCGCGSDSAVAADMAIADMTLRGEFCGTGTRCCTTERGGDACATGDSCKPNSRCAGYLTCPAGVWIVNSFACADLSPEPRD